jgi:MFS family permease
MSSIPADIVSESGVVAKPAEPAPVRGSFLAIYTFASFASWVALITPIAVTLALRVNQIDPAGKASSLATITSLGALCAMLAGPLAGMFSDRTISRIGKRRPWMLAGIFGGVCGLYIVATASSVAGLVIGWCLTQTMFATGGAATLAILPDHVPEAQRGKLSGLIGMSQQIGVAVGITITQVFSKDLFYAVMVPGLLGLLGYLWLAYVVPDKPADAHRRPPLDFKGLLLSYWVNPRKHPDFGWAWIGRFMISMGFAIMANYSVYYLTDKLGYKAEEIPRLLLIGSLAGMVVTTSAAIIGGILSDRLGRRKVFVIASAILYAIGMTGVAMAPNFEVYLAWSMVTGVAIGTYSAIDLALVTQVLPNPDNRAKDMSVFGIASVMPQSIAPALAPLFLSIGGPNNYVALYMIAGAFGILGALATLPIKGVR